MIYVQFLQMFGIFAVTLVSVISFHFHELFWKRVLLINLLEQFTYQMD